MEEELLKEYVGTYLNPKYNGDWDLINSKFPELSGVDKQLLKEYVGTYLNPKYNSDWSVVNSKFPELFPAGEPDTEQPLAEQSKKKEDSVSPFVDGGSGLTKFDQEGSVFKPGEGISIPADAKPTAVPSAPVEEPEKRGGKSYLENIAVNLGLGASYANEAVASIPESIVNILAIPQNYIAEKTGLPIGVTAEGIKESWGITNPLLDYVKEDQKILSGEVSKFMADRYEDPSIVGNFEKGNYQDGFELLGSAITQSIPISVGLMIGGAYTTPAKLATVATLGFTEDQRESLAEMDPTMSEAEKTIKAAGMAGAESVFSSIGTATIGKVYRDIAKREGAEAAKGIFKDGLVQAYKKAIEKTGVVAGFAGEGIEEAATQITQNVISGRPAFEGAADAFVTGAGSGVVFTAPVSAINAKRYIDNKVTSYDTKTKVTEILKDKAKNIGQVYNVPVSSEISTTQLDIANLPNSRDLLVNDLKKSVSRGDIGIEGAKQSLFVFDKVQQVSNSVKDLNISTDDKAKVATLLRQRDDLRTKIQNKDDVLVVQEKRQIEGINNQIQQILLTPQQDAIQEQAAGQVPVQEVQEAVIENIESDRKVDLKNANNKNTDNDNTDSDIAYHGTPFNYDTFDAAKVGTGEGASKRGIGIYFKRSKVLAPFFANINSDDAPIHIGKGKSKVDKSKVDPHVLEVSGFDNLNLKKGSSRDVSSWANNQKQYVEEGFDGFETQSGEITVFPESISKIKIKEKNTLTDFIGKNPSFAFREWTTQKNKEKSIIEGKINAKYDAEIAALQPQVVAQPVTETITPAPTVQPQVETLRAQEQAELAEALTDADQYMVDGKIDGEKITDPAEKKIFDDIYNKYDKLITPLIDGDVAVQEEVEPTQEEIDLEDQLAEDLDFIKSETKPRFRIEGIDIPAEEDINLETIETNLDRLPAYEVNFTTPEVSQDIQVNPIEESKSSIKDGVAETRSIESFQGVPMIVGMSDTLAAGTVVDSIGNPMSVEGGLLYNVLGKNKNAAWAGVTEKGALTQYNEALELYNNNKNLFDKLWSEGKLPNGHVPMAIMKMADTAVNSNEAVFRYLSPLVKAQPEVNQQAALDALKGDIDVKKKVKQTATAKSASKLNDFISSNNINSLGGLLDAIISDANIRAKGDTKNTLSLSERSLLFDLMISPQGTKTASKNTVNALFGSKKDPKSKAFLADNIYEAIGEPAMIRIPRGNIAAVVGVDVLNGGVVPVEHGNYGFGPKGQMIALISNPKHGLDVFPEWKAKAVRVFKKTNPKKGEGKLPTASAIADEVGGAFFMDSAFRNAKVSMEPSDVELLAAKLRFAFPDVTVSNTKEEFDRVLQEEGVRTKESDGKVILGMTKDGKVYLNPESDSLATPIHEFGHIWIDFLRSKSSGKKGDALLSKGLSLVEGTRALQQAIAKYGDNALAREEALVELMGTKGESIINKSKKKEFKNWLNALFKYAKEFFTTSEQLFKGTDFEQTLKDMSLDDFINIGLADLLKGQAVSAEFKAKDAGKGAAELRFRVGDNVQSFINKARAQGYSETAIKNVLTRSGVDVDAIDTALSKDVPAAKKVEVTEEFAPGYNRVLNEIFGKDGVVAKSRRRGRTEDEAMQNAIDYLEQDTKVYENATDVQREAMVRNVRKEFKKREKAAPSAEKVVGKPKKKKVTVDEMAALKDQIRLEARAAREAKGDLNDKRKALAAKVSALKGKGTVTVNQVDTIVKRIERTNLDNPIMVDRLLAYIEKVFDNANYAADMTELRKLQAQAKSRNHTSMTNVVKQFTSINPENIPLDRIQEYKKALDFLNNRTPSYATMNEMLDEMLSYQVTEEFDAIKTMSALKKKYEDIMSNKVKTVEDYVNLIKDINSFKRRAFQLLQNEEITQENYDDLIKMVGKDQAAVEKNYEKEITEIKKDLIAEIKNQRPKVSRDFSDVENDLIRKYLELSEADLEGLSPEDLFILNDLLENISNGEIDYYRFSDIVSKAFSNDAIAPITKQVDASKFNMGSERGRQELSEQESAFWEGLLGMGRAKVGALQKFIISPFNRAIGSFENFIRKGYNEFLDLKRKYKIKDDDMHKIGILTTYLQEHMAQFDSKNKDVKDIGNRDWFKEILSDKSMRDKYSSGKPSILKMIGVGKSEIDIVQKIWDSLPKDKDGNVDPKAVYDSYIANDGKFFTKNEKAFFDDVMAYKTSTITPKQKAANELSGQSFKEIPFHMLRVRLDAGGNQIQPSATSENGVVRIKAGTGKERTSEKVGAVMTNFEKLFISSIEQTGRDYFLSGALKDINNTLAGVRKNIGKDKMPLLDTISYALSDALKYEFDRTKSNLIFRNLLSARAAITLLNPIRTAVELGSTLTSYPVRAKNISGYKSLFGEQGAMKKLLEFTNSPMLLRDNISKAIDINDGSIEPQSKFTKATNYLSGLPERTMMVTSWMPTFKSEFKNITGIDFDMNKFNNSEAYKEKYGKAIRESSAAADAQTEKIIGPTTKAGQRREVRIAPRFLANIFGLEGTVSKNTPEGQILGFFSNYPFRESTEFLNGFREAAEVLNDEGALSSLSQLQKPLGIALNVAAYGFLSSVTYALGLMLLGDDDDEKRGDDLLKNLITGEGFLNELASNAISLAGSKYAAGGKAMLQLAATIAIESTDDEEQKAKIKKLLKDSVFVNPLPIEQASKFGGRDKIMTSIGMYIPQFVIAVDRYLDLVGTVKEVGVIYDKVEKNGVKSLTEDEGLQVLALNTVFNTTQIILNLGGKSIPAYNNIKTYMNGLKEEAGVADVYKGEAPAKKKSSGGGGGRAKTINKSDLKRYFPEGSATYEIEQEVKAFEKEQREFKKRIKDQVYGN